MTGVEIRIARDDELHRLGLLAAEAVTPEIVAGGSGFAAARTERLLDSDLVFVAEADGHLAGYAAVSEVATALVVDQLVVGVADEGRGVGNRLLDWVEGYAISRAAQAVRVVVEPDNRRALEFYGDRGYVAGASGALERELVHA